MIETNNPEKKADYYDKVFKNSEKYNCSFAASPYFDLWLRLIHFLPKQKDIAIADYGCGTGQLLQMLEYYDYTYLWGFDFSLVSIEIANILTDHSQIFYEDITKQKINLDFDVIICTEVLEHIENDIEVLSKWDAKQIIVTVPTYNSESHVRYFESKQDVIERYGKYFAKYEVVQVGKFFILNGLK